MFFFALVVGYVIRLMAGGLSPLPPAVGEGVGGLLLLAGVAFMVRSVMIFADAGETLPPNTPARQLLVEGPYRFSRNPIYLAMALICGGFGLATSNLWIVLTTVAAGAVTHYFVIRPEEAYLAERFGDAYDAYAKKVRRWI